MDKRTYFLQCMRDRMYTRKDWILSAFAVFFDAPDDWSKDPYPNRLVYRDDVLCFMDMEQNGDFTPIDGYVFNTALFVDREPLELRVGDLPNVVSDVTTTYGRALFNSLCLVYPFGAKVPYINDAHVSIGKLTAIVTKMQDVPKDPKDRKDDVIYVDEYITFATAVGNLAGLTQLTVPAASPKSLTVDPKVIAERDRLLKVHKDELEDPAVVAKISKTLADMDRESFKGDPAEGFLISKKSFEVVRMKRFIMQGEQGGFGGKPELIASSLSEGWDMNKFPAAIDGQRYGSFNRGAMTALGGESVKYFYKVFQNSRVIEDDCGATVGVDWLLDDTNKSNFIGHYQLKGGKSQVITTESVSELLGRVVTIRSPGYCHTRPPAFCRMCIGDKLSMNPDSLASATANVGSTFMGVFMGAMHGKALVTEKLDWQTEFS